ncbi:MAG: hypothetical protein ACOXZR_02265 [Bacilli bacterium]|jgi:hypothetical protein
MKKRGLIISLILLMISFMVIYLVPSAKYVAKTMWNYYFQAQAFYFTSDSLGEEEVINVNNFWMGEEITFTLRNFSNESLITEFDIEYQVTCSIEGGASSWAECRLMKTNKNTYEGILESSFLCFNAIDEEDVSTYEEEECLLEGYEWRQEEVLEEISFEVVVTNQNHQLSDLTVNIEVKSISPYKKTLLGKFNLHKIEEETKPFLKYNNYSNYGELIVINPTSSNQCLQLTWDSSKLLFDSPNVNGSIKFNIKADKSLKFLFYPHDLKSNYSIEDFTISKTSGC